MVHLLWTLFLLSHDAWLIKVPGPPFSLSADLYCRAARQAMWRRYRFLSFAHKHTRAHEGTQLLSHMNKADSRQPLNAALTLRVRAAEAHARHASRHTAGRKSKTEYYLPFGKINLSWIRRCGQIHTGLSFKESKKNPHPPRIPKIKPHYLH